MTSNLNVEPANGTPLTVWQVTAAYTPHPGDGTQVSAFAFRLGGESRMHYSLENKTGEKQGWRISSDYALVFGSPIQVNRSHTWGGLTFGDIHNALVDAMKLDQENYWENLPEEADEYVFGLMMKKVTE
jgi:hypothetical protein